MERARVAPEFLRDCISEELPLNLEYLAGAVPCITPVIENSIMMMEALQFFPARSESQTLSGKVEGKGRLFTLSAIKRRALAWTRGKN